jgi:3,4-dihydroxy 2-butanone 4-phosphate synthase/GTP cyclohydrolase II
MKNPFISIKEAIIALQKGQMIILMDDENRENEGDLVLAGQFVSADAINFMARFGRGLICLSMAGELVDRLNLPMMTQHNRSPYGTAFTVSIEASNGVSTGISAADRAHTIKVAIDANSTPSDLVSPGHMFPLRARDKGVLERAGQTEGSVDLMRLANLTPAAVICEILNEDGTMSRRQQLEQFADIHKIPLVLIKDLIEYRIKNESLIEEVATTRLPLLEHGEFSMKAFTNQLDKSEHFALVKPPLDSQQIPLVRIHSECITGDVFGSCKCDCGSQLHQSLQAIGKEGGVLIYLRQEGRGIGLANKLKAYALQEQGLDTVEANLKLGFPADQRNYAVAYQILKYLGIDTLRLLTNNPAKVDSLEQFGLNISQRIPLNAISNQDNLRYLRTKKEKMGHLLVIEE